MDTVVTNISTWTPEDWDKAFDFFTTLSPVDWVNNEFTLKAQNPTWDDYGFNGKTKFPDNLGFTSGVDNRAIALVIARSRKRGANWTKPIAKQHDRLPLTPVEILAINAAVWALYGPQ